MKMNWEVGKIFISSLCWGFAQYWVIKQTRNYCIQITLLNNRCSNREYNVIVVYYLQMSKSANGFKVIPTYMGLNLVAVGLLFCTFLNQDA